jgi:shikimate kinase
MRSFQKKKRYLIGMADMDTIVADQQQVKQTSCHRALIVEIVGPAGAGKTTLFQALEKLDPGFRTEFLPPVWNFWYIPFFVKYILLLVPTLIRLKGNGDRNLNRRELAWMAMLKGWPTILRKKAEGDQKMILLDQGPIFLIALLSEFGPKSLRHSNMQGYWEKIIEQWIHTLDIVIWLDASDEILMQRIRTRRDEHLVKDKTDQEIKEFLAKYRVVYERLINTMMTNSREIRVLRIDTAKNSVDDIVRSVIEYSKGEWK